MKEPDYFHGVADDVGAVLAARQKTYGDFETVAEMAIALRRVLAEARPTGSAAQRIALDMITLKLARIAAGDPNHIDSWVDIAGYATLVADILKREAA